MAEWVKLSTNAFVNRKLKIIRAYPNGDSMALLWFNLICLAGEVNDNGYVYVTDDVAYTAETLAAAYDYDVEIVERALKLFQQFKMISVEDNGYIYILGWNEHQNSEGLAKIKARERSKESMRKKRERESQQEAKTDASTETATPNENVNSDVNTMLTDVNVNNVLTVNDVNINNELTSADVNTQNKSKSKNKSIEDINHLESTSIKSRDDWISPTLQNSQLLQEYEMTFGPICNDVTADGYIDLVKEFDEATVLEALQRTREKHATRPGYAYKVAESIVAKRNKPPTTYSKKNDVQAAANAVIARIKARGET